ncbi:MAG: archaemetzincin family Zn-dependent metalloprotease [Acidobacteria bacterium]|nr:archaemetzincin family Zn-dependent metalloprotease [Acidobacteriota bacterium]MCL5288927.1 archaemetzincin family Zn-dependent metalloprotease [Acidobacteriota bacterium]
MNGIELLPVGEVDGAVLEELRNGLRSVFRVSSLVLDRKLDPTFARHAVRNQFHSSEILAQMHDGLRAGVRRVGVASVDLYVPILTFVFGEAEVGGACAVVSIHRLRQEFYGLPADPDLERERLLKEAVHELGHTLELTHCNDYRCAMAASHSVEWIDMKEAQFCEDCRNSVSRLGSGNSVRAGRYWI